MKYVYFGLIDHKPKTNVYHVCSRSDDSVLGIVKWYAPWRQYCFFPKGETVWSRGCWNQVNNFIDELMEKRKKKTVKETT